MNVRVLYFARLREAFGLAEEALSLPGEAASAADLVALLRARGGVWARELGERPFRVAVNQALVSLEVPLKAGDEVAIFPPVTGG